MGFNVYVLWVFIKILAGSPVVAAERAGVELSGMGKEWSGAGRGEGGAHIVCTLAFCEEASTE